MPVSGLVKISGRRHGVVETKYARLKSVRTCRRKMLSPNSTQRINRITLENNINAEVLSQMKAVFDRADIDGGGFLDMDEFINAFLGEFGLHSSKQVSY